MEGKYRVRRESSFVGNIHKDAVVKITNVKDRVAEITDGYNHDEIMVKDLERCKTGYKKIDIIVAAREGRYIKIDHLVVDDMDGKNLANYLKDIGFKVIKHYDTGRNGLVITQEGVKVSTNGYCSMVRGN